MELMIIALVIIGVLALLAYCTTWLEPKDIDEPTPEQAGIMARAVAALIEKIRAGRL